jgi:MFS family permease
MIVYYGTQYFQNAGFTNPFITTVITNSVNVVSTLPGLYMVEKLGRRNLLLLGAVGMCVCQYIVAITGTVAGTTDLPAQRASIAFVCIYIFFFASSWGPVAWVVTGEMFPLKARAKCLSMTTASVCSSPPPSLIAYTDRVSRTGCSTGPLLTPPPTWWTRRAPTCNRRSSSSGAPSASFASLSCGS